MASTDHHVEGSAHPSHGNGNGFDAYTEWLGFAPGQHPRNYYELLRIQSDADERTIGHVITELRTKVEGYLEGSHAGTARKLLGILRQAGEQLLDEDKRAVYDKKHLPKSATEPDVGRAAASLHESVANVIPGTVLKGKKSPEGPLTRIGKVVKKKPWIVAASAGVVAGAAALFAWNRQGNTPQAEQPATPAERNLPPGSPELAQNAAPPTQQEKNIPVAPDIPAQPTETTSPPAKPETPATPPPANPEIQEPAPKPAPPAEVSPPNTFPIAQPAPAEAARPSRSPVPTAEDLAQYRDLLSNPELMEASVEELLAQAQRSQDRTKQWTLLKIALRKARSERNLVQVTTVLSEMQRHFDYDETAFEESVAAVREAAQQKGGNVEQVMIHASGVIRSMCVRGNFVEAKRFIAWLKDRPSANKPECNDLSRTVSQLQKAYEEQNIAAQEETLVRDPQNAEANRAVGLYYCFDQGDWSYAPALRASGNSTLQNLADRVGRRSELPAADLYQLAQDLLAQRTPPGAGAVAMAVQCLELAEPKSGDFILTARIKRMRGDLGQSHASTLPFFRGEQLRSPVAAPQPQEVRLDVPGTLPAGTVNLMGNDTDALLKRGTVVRDRWQVAKEGQTEFLQGTSGYHSWVASISLPLSDESKQVVAGGQYTCRYVFTRTGEGRKEGAIQGATTFVVPLPNGQSISICWDANMEKNAPGEYRSYIDAVGLPPPQRGATVPSVDHARPVVTENGLENVCDVTVRTVPGGFLIETMIGGRNDVKPLGRLTAAVPPTVRSAPYLLGEGNKRMPAALGAPWGMGVGGGTVRMKGAQIIPLRGNVGQPLGQVISDPHERRNLPYISGRQRSPR
ncbi:MAG: hypothetical protein PHX87_01040 [Candidatus Peribacteraceae bacterium]|nr:hypothetical protein [Candidatus Peribacteraceae bacterium]MDD5741995.1 hypothetical protein [Candidatus Peribacteraceae bacterium]